MSKPKPFDFCAAVLVVAPLMLVQPALAINSADANDVVTAVTAVKFDIAGFFVDGNTLLPTDEIQQTLAPFTGAGRTMEDVTRAAAALRSLYLDAGYAVVQVHAPQQAVSMGQVVLKVLEDKIKSIDVKGHSAYGIDNILASLPQLEVNQSFNAKRVESAIALANENSAKQVAVNVQPGTVPGDILTMIDVTEDRIRRLVATYDDTGSEATGSNKVGLTWQNANLLDSDHALTLQYGGTLDHVDKVYSLSAGYHIPFYALGVSADLMAAYSSSSGQNVNLYFAGKGTVLAGRLNYPLATMGYLRHKLILGADYKDSESVSGPLTTPITETPASLTWFAQMASPGFQGNANVTWVRNLGGGAHGQSADYYDQTTGRGARTPISGPASSNFPGDQWQAVRIGASGGLNLPLDWQARAGLNAQLSGDLLLPSEQFGAGGVSSVRGYPERILSGDQGYTVNFELYTPELNPYVGGPDASLRALVFVDGGRVSINDTPLPAGFRASQIIYSVGFGLRMTYKKDITFKLDIGKAQRAAGAAPLIVNQGDVRGNVLLSVAF